MKDLILCATRINSLIQNAEHIRLYADRTVAAFIQACQSFGPTTTSGMSPGPVGLRRGLRYDRTLRLSLAAGGGPGRAAVTQE
eukprot:765032-Hanusia_phi.AAC.8